jgi:hypothetical protein
VRANLTPGDGAGQTLVSIHTSLNVTGKPAQFGRSLLPEVSGKLIQQFATNLEAMINADSAAAAGTAAPGTDEAVADAAVADEADAGVDAARTGQEPAGPAQTAPAAARPAAPVVQQEESLNAFKFIVVPILKRLIPVAAAGAAIAVVVRRLRRRKS